MLIAETDRLIIRRFLPEDLPQISRVFTDPRATRFTLTGTFTAPQVAKWLERVRDAYETGTHGVWAVVLRDTAEVVGYCALTRPEVEGLREDELGYRIDPDRWGQGLATEAARAIRDYAFGQLGVPRIISLIQAENLASIRVAEKLGMQFERETVFSNTRLRLYALQCGTSMGE